MSKGLDELIDSYLDEDGHIGEVLAVPGVEGLEQLEPVRLGVHVYLEFGALAGGRLVCVLTRVESLHGQLRAKRVGQLELLA